MSLWPLFFVLAVVALLVAMLAVGPRLFRGTRAVATGLWCPFRRQDVDIVFRVEAWEGRRVDVERCSAFSPPTSVTCDKGCLDRHALVVAADGRPARA